jgi:hypothetical protein
MAGLGAVFAVLLVMPSMSSAATRHLHQFSSPDRTIWCFEFAGVFGCNATPPPSVSRASEYVAYLNTRGGAGTCSPSSPKNSCVHFAKQQNVVNTAPVLAYGEVNEFLGLRCTSESTGVTCTKVAGGLGAGNGFRINTHEAVRIGSSSTNSAPTPTIGRTATARTVSGTVLVETPGSASFTPLSALTSVPMGTTIDTTNGTVQLTSATDRRGHTQTGQFYGGAFQLAQRHVRSQQRRGARAELTVLRLTGGTADECPAVGARATAARRRRRTQLWGRTHGGSFAAETHDVVAGRNDPTWLTEETCSGTLVKVVQWNVSVENLRTHRTVTVRAGHSLLTASGSPTPASRASLWTALGGKVRCGVDGGLPPQILCEDQAIPAPPGKTTEESNPVVVLRATGQPIVARVMPDAVVLGDPLPVHPSVPLHASQTWSLGSEATCAIGVAAVRCTNRSGHGFTLTTSSYAAF